MKYRAEIDGLRALAVIPVILFHAGFKTFSGGFVGVDVFFVISGYLITTILLNDLRAGNLSLVHFYERRARRILPALFFVMFVSLPLAWLWLLPQDMKSFSQSLIAVSVFASNILFWRTSGYFDAAAELNPLMHTWSLSVEEQYYLLFPLFLLLTRKLGRRSIAALLVLVAVTSLSLAQYLSTKSPATAFYLLPTRAWELMVGALVALYYADRNIEKHKYIYAEVGSLLGMALIAYSICGYTNQASAPSLGAVAPVLGACLIIIFSTRDTLVGKILSSKACVGIGLISYSAYLWHQPIFAFARHRSSTEPGMALMGILAILPLPLAYLSWRYVEQPFRSRRLLTRRQLFSFCLLVLLMFCLLGFALPKFDSARLKPTSIVGETGQAEFYNYIKARFPNCEEHDVRATSSYFENLQMCQQSKPGKLDIVLLGDSHAEVLFYGLANKLPQTNIGYYVHWEKPYLSNPKFNAIFEALAKESSPKTVILTMNYYGRLAPENNDLYDNFKEVIAYLKKLGKDVILVGDAPRYPYDADRCKYIRAFESPSAASCALPILQAHKQQALYLETLQTLAREFGIDFVDLHPVFCDANNCHMTRDNQLLYRDNHHISRYGSDLVVEYIIRHSSVLAKISGN